MQAIPAMQSPATGGGAARRPGGNSLWRPRLAAVALLWLVPCLACAATVVLRVSVVNQLDREHRKEVRSNLPMGVAPEDVLELDGMELRYDVAGDRYYVYRAVDLAPKERVDFRVAMRDVWIVPDDEIALLSEQTQRLGTQLEDTEFGALGAEMAQAIAGELLTVSQDQQRFAISGGALVADHIRVYFANRAVLDDVRNRIGHLENLVLGAGRDPGQLVGTLENAPPASQPGLREAPVYQEAVIRISVSNTSQEQPRVVTLRRDLPRELQARDVLDPDGLEVGIDPVRATAYVFHEGLELEPGETRTFSLRIRDPWNVHGPHIRTLRDSATRLLERVRAMPEYPSVATFLEEVLVDLDALRDAPAPTEVNDRYVAFFRGQGERLEAISRRIGRVETVLQKGPTTQRLGFDVQPPDPKTTWLIIYSILGFMGALSLLFFLRWYGAGKSGKREP